MISQSFYRGIVGKVRLGLCVGVIGAGLLGVWGCSSDETKSQEAQSPQTQDIQQETQSKEEAMKQSAQKPNIVILATGGTIAGSTDSELKTTGYQAGVVGVEALIQAVPQIKDIANIEGEQVANIDSADMSDELWLTLSKRINELLANPKVDGVVITHGTDTMEESAYFLNLVVKSQKPVVLVGAMRPSTAMSADGAKNLYNAIALASSVDSHNRGVMVMMNDRVQSARFVSKTHALNVNAFSSPQSGDMGYVIDGAVFFNYHIDKLHTAQSEFDVSHLTALPKVDILYSYANDGSATAAEALFKAGAKGIVVAGTGAGSIHKDQKAKLIELLQSGLFVVESSRVNNGIILPSAADSERGFIGSGDLNPQKARVLLMLALTKTQDRDEIRQIFARY